MLIICRMFCYNAGSGKPGRSKEVDRLTAKRMMMVFSVLCNLNSTDVHNQH